MAEDKTQVNFKVTAQDIEAIDALARIDGYDNRSAWVRTHLRAVINARRAELATVTSLPRPTGAQVVPVVTTQAQA